jgi:hypothetical protein
MDSKLQDGYLDAICAHIKEAGTLAPHHVVDTVYFGGGTPSFFGADGMASILSAVRRNFDVSASAEITFEANPDSVTPKLLRRLRSEGFNRVSLGIQCDNDRILESIGRPHTYDDAVEAVNKIRKAGFRNLSVDLIYGLPGQTLADWEKTLRNVLTLDPDHISCYGLKVEEGTPLYACQSVMQLPDDDSQADMYLTASEILRTLGYPEREIELARIAGYMHDIGNCINRTDHAQSGALMAFRLLDRMGMPPEDVATVITAIGNHDEQTAHPVNAVAAALIIADKSDVRRSRVRNKATIDHDIHDRVNYAVEQNDLSIDTEAGTIALSLTIDTGICSVMNYFEIFTARMLLCRKASKFLGLRFKLSINGADIM